MNPKVKHEVKAAVLKMMAKAVCFSLTLSLISTALVFFFEYRNKKRVPTLVWGKLLASHSWTSAVWWLGFLPAADVLKLFPVNKVQSPLQQICTKKSVSMQVLLVCADLEQSFSASFTHQLKQAHLCSFYLFTQMWSNLKANCKTTYLYCNKLYKRTKLKIAWLAKPALKCNMLVHLVQF